jgi:hypothetical protein
MKDNPTPKISTVMIDLKLRLLLSQAEYGLMRLVPKWITSHRMSAWRQVDHEAAPSATINGYYVPKFPMCEPLSASYCRASLEGNEAQQYGQLN